jgi:hypothetical protein
MNAITLTGQSADGKEVTRFACGKCMKVTETHTAATRCCNWKCRNCGTPINYYVTLCRACCDTERDRKGAARLAKAEKFETWDGGVFWNDAYFPMLEEAVDAIADCYENDDWPEYIYVAKPVKLPELDLSDILEVITRDMSDDDDPESYLKGVPALEAAIDAFNAANVDIKFFEEDYKRAVRVPREVKP